MRKPKRLRRVMWMVSLLIMTYSSTATTQSPRTSPPAVAPPSAPASARPAAPWKELAPGMELGVFEARKKSMVGDSKITVLRLDPGRWRLRLLCADDLGLPHGLTAKGWCKRYDLAAAVNAGMFAGDGRTHLGYLKSGAYVNPSHINKYESVAAFDPKSPNRPRFRIFDRDDPEITMERVLADYSCVVQNLRLIKRPGINRWSPQEKMWSEAALGEDEQGRILMLFARSPWSMHDFNEEVLRLGIGVVALQHLEGGPEAQLYVRQEALERFGSYETSFETDDRNDHAWPVPNVIGVVGR